MKLGRKLFSKNKNIPSEVEGAALIGAGIGVNKGIKKVIRPIGGEYSSRLKKLEKEVYSKSPEVIDEITKVVKRSPVTLTETNSRTSYRINNGGDRFININPGDRRPSTLAHEFGHFKNQEKLSKTGKKLKSIRHSLKRDDKLPLFAGFTAGVNSARRKSEGKEDNTFTKYGGVISGVAGNIPTLAEEGRASIRAMNMIKQAGANKKQLSVSGKSLGNAFASYLTSTGASAATGLAAQGAGKLAGGLYYRIKDKKKSRD